MQNKKHLIKIANQLDLKGISKLNKTQLIDFIVNNPCTKLTVEDCSKLSRDELRTIARKCNVKISNKLNDKICNEIHSKYKNVDTSIFKNLQLKSISKNDDMWSTETLESGKVSSTKSEKIEEPEWVEKLLNTPNEEPIVIKTNKTPKQVIQKIIQDDTTYNTSCKLDLISVKELNAGASGAGIFSAILKESKDNVIIKIWKVDEKHVFKKHESLSCLDGEWQIYTYLVPLIFNKKLSPNVLVPFDSGICKVNQLKSQIQNINMSQTDIAKYVSTPYIKLALFDVLNSKNIDTVDAYFQVVYTLAVFNKLGLRHNDIHTGNVRVLENLKKPFRIAYTLKDVVVFCQTSNLMLINDFDRSGLSQHLTDKLKIKNLCTEKDGYQCKHVHQCNQNIEGKRDLLVFSYYIFNYLPETLRLYVLSEILCSNDEAKKHFIKYVTFDDKSVTIIYDKSKNHDYLYFKLNDKNASKMYPPIEKILNDRNFISFCVNLSPRLKLNVKNYNDYDVYKYNYNNI